MGAVDVGGGRKAAGGGPSWKRPRVPIRIDMTPMVDIAFLLLIFFMVTTVFRLPQAMEMNLPEANPDQPPITTEVFEERLIKFWVMRINDRDSIAYSIGNASPNPLSWDSVRAKLNERRAATFKGTVKDLEKIDDLLDAAGTNLVRYADNNGVDKYYAKLDTIADNLGQPRMNQTQKDELLDKLRKIDKLTVLARIDRKCKYNSLVNLVDEFNVAKTTRFSIDKYTTLDDSLMRAANFTTGGPAGLPEPVFVE